MLNFRPRNQDYEKSFLGILIYLKLVKQTKKNRGLFLRKECLGASHITSLNVFYKMIMQNYDNHNFLCHLIRYLYT